MQSVQTVTFVLNELDQQVTKYNWLHRAQSSRSYEPPANQETSCLSWNPKVL